MIEILSKEEILTFLTEHSRYRIAKETDITKQTLANYASDRTCVGNMSLDKAIKLTKYYKEVEK